MKKHKSCVHCNETFKGRSDKKFCSMDCRSNFNNRRNREKNNVMRNVNRVLRKNRMILHEIIQNHNEPIPLSELQHLGFRLSYCTHVKYQNNKIIQCCYEFGVLAHGNNTFSIIRENHFDAKATQPKEVRARLINLRPAISIASNV